MKGPLNPKPLFSGFQVTAWKVIHQLVVPPDTISKEAQAGEQAWAISLDWGLQFLIGNLVRVDEGLRFWSLGFGVDYGAYKAYKME